MADAVSESPRKRVFSFPPRSQFVRAGDVTLDLYTHVAYVDGQEVELTKREFWLLEMLLRHRGQVLTDVQLLELVWGSAFYDRCNVKLTVRHLRQKLGQDVIRNKRGHGYFIPRAA